MQINVHRRAAAARLLLDAVTSFDEEVPATDGTDNMALRVLKPLGLDLEGDEKVAATMAATLDLLYFLLTRLAPHEGASREELISNMRAHVLPRAYRDAYDG